VQNLIAFHEAHELVDDNHLAGVVGGPDRGLACLPMRRGLRIPARDY
jgi:hypothetical protein